MSRTEGVDQGMENSELLYSQEPPPLQRIDSREGNGEWPGYQRSYQYQQQSPDYESRGNQPLSTTPQATVTNQPVQLSDLLHMMQLQNAASQALEERRLRLEEEKMQLERERLADERTREARRVAAAAEDKAARIKERELDRRLKEIPQLPRMTNDEDVEMYLVGFEKRMKSLEIPQNRWVSNLRPLLSEWALQTVETLGGHESEDYTRAKTTLLHAFESTQGSLGKRVLNPKRKPGQRAAHLAAQLQRAWSHWIEGLTHQEICAKL